MGRLTAMQMDILREFMKYPSVHSADYPLLGCNPVFHEEHSRCLTEHGLDWLRGLLRALRIYIPVHWLPLILLTPSKMLKDPLHYALRKSINTLRSSVFLTSYQCNMKLTECIGRRWIDSDIAALSMTGGIAAGTAILMEAPNRRSEIVLYVIPRAIEILLNLMPHRWPWTVLGHDLIPAAAFALSLAMWMAVRQCHGVIDDQKTASNKGKGRTHRNICNDLNMTVLSVIFGRFH